MWWGLTGSSDTGRVIDLVPRWPFERFKCISLC